MRKGQLFLISGVVVIIVIILLKTSLNLVKILENKHYLEAGLETLEFNNVEDEIIKTIQISYTQKQNISTNVNNFARFAKSCFSAKTVELNGFFVESIYSGSSQLNTTVFNFLGSGIIFLNLTMNTTPPQSQLFYSMGDGTAVETNFTFSDQGNYSLKVFYNTSYENRTEEIIIPYETGKSKFTGFFDLRLTSSRGEQGDKFTETVDLQ
jgi:hypothetical protein